MNVDIHIPGAKLFDALRSYTERVVHLAVGAGPAVSRVAVPPWVVASQRSPA